MTRDPLKKRATARRYNQSAKGKAAYKRYARTAKGRAAIRRKRERYASKNKMQTAKWQKSPAGRAWFRRYAGLPEPTRPCPEFCECCGKPPGKQALSLDHNHQTGAFRGWLCHRCNLGIGALGDKMDGVLKAVDYLIING